MGEEIFRHADRDGDVIRLERATTANPLLRAYVDSENEFALLDRDAVLSLIQTLTEWAYPTHTPEGPNRSLIEDLIAKAVKDQVSAVLPLHLSPAALRCRRCGIASGMPHDGCAGDARECVFIHPGDPGYQLLGPEADPEPGDVGHPRPPAAEDGPCADCHHSKDRHRPACAVVHVGVRNVQEAGVCRCNAYKAPAAEVTPPETCRCGHGKDRHRPHCAVVMRDDHGVICRCDGFGPSLPERKTCPHGLGWSVRCGKCEMPRPVEPIAFKPPYCGLCKQPWSDGHGQPGDPCPGVEEARQHPGDWTDALWRVRPSAPASDARYCDGCGHSWESHDPECGATRGKGRCECDRRPE